MNKLHRVSPCWSNSEEFRETMTTLQLFDEGMKHCGDNKWRIRFLTEVISRMIDELNVDTRTVLQILDLENNFDEVKDE